MNSTPVIPPKCIIFDCDGILVDSEHITFSVLAEMSREVGVRLSEAELEANFLGKSLKSIIAFLEVQTDLFLAATFEPDFRKRTFAKFGRGRRCSNKDKEAGKYLQVFSPPYHRN